MFSLLLLVGSPHQLTDMNTVPEARAGFDGMMLKVVETTCDVRRAIDFPDGPQAMNRPEMAPVTVRTAFQRVSTVNRHLRGCTWNLALGGDTVEPAG